MINLTSAVLAFVGIALYVTLRFGLGVVDGRESADDDHAVMFFQQVILHEKHDSSDAREGECPIGEQ